MFLLPGDVWRLLTGDTARCCSYVLSGFHTAMQMPNIAPLFRRFSLGEV